MKEVSSISTLLSLEEEVVLRKNPSLSCTYKIVINKESKDRNQFLIILILIYNIIIKIKGTGEDNNKYF